MKHTELLKPYNIVHDTDDGATVDMYGEVVEERPVDWWTGKPIEGNFIVLSEFLADLESLKEKKNVTVHINSVGGSFYAGLAIYNRLRTLGASITTINDSLAASAGSIIFMAGDKGKRKVHAASNLMVHGVLGFLYGYYNVQDLKTAINTLKSHDKAAVAAYMEATGLDAETVKAAMSKDTYMTGEEAVAAGWADEVITAEDSEPVSMKLTPYKSRLMVNGHAVAACLFGNLPTSIPQMSEDEWAEAAETKNVVQPAPQAGKNNENGGKQMEIKSMEELRSAFPDLMAQAEAAAKAEGAKAERARIQGIEEIRAAIGDAEMVKEAMFGEAAMTAETLAFNAMKKQAAQGAEVVLQLEKDAKTSNAAGVETAPVAPTEPKATNEDEEAEKLLCSAIPENLKMEVK